jgi:hypothetical protein
MIGGIKLEVWKAAFLRASGMDKSYFEDILYYELYPNIEEELAGIDEDDEDAICDVYNAKMDYADEAHKAIFGVSYL